VSASTPDNRRKVLRAPAYDYSTPGYYFVTICIQDHALTFGDIVDGHMVSNDYGTLAIRAWDSLPARFHGVSLDAFVIMPNHIHAIVGLGVEADVAAQFIAPSRHRSQGVEEMSNSLGSKRGAMNRAATPDLPSLGNVIRVFKAVSSNQIRRAGLPTFKWQANYYDRIVRNDRELDRIRTYINVNPGNWHRDQDNPTVLCRGDALRRPAQD
jgi:putative transposase